MLHALLETTFNVRERVDRGAERLDRCRPGWAPEIDTERLNMAHVWRCPLGQLYGDYLRGLAAVGIASNHVACRHGFIGHLIGAFIPPLARLEDRLLRDAWIAAIRERTEQAGRDRVRTLLLPCRTDFSIRRDCRETVAIGVPSYALQE